MRNAWRFWCRVLGRKLEPDSNKISDAAAILRTLWVLLHVITCGFIIANALHQW